jgi:hydrogenase expression/formation protein HypC
MCVGLSARVVSVNDGTAVIDASGARRAVSAELLADLEPGDYVMVHAGVAIAKIDGSDADEVKKVTEEVGNGRFETVH